MTRFEDLKFEDGRLVKINGMRPEYMDGYKLIRLVREISQLLLQERQSRALEAMARETEDLSGSDSP